MKNLLSKIFRSQLHFLLAYLIIFVIFFIPIKQGVGQFWDWTFPYYKDQISQVFQNSSMSWVAKNSGSPLSYSSDYFFRFVISRFTFLQPETLHYFLLIIMFATGAFGVYLITRRRLNKGAAFLLGLAAFINPAMNYKLMSGHFNYFLSYMIFIFLLNFLLFHFKPDRKHAVILGLLLAISGAQIQFFLINILALAIYFLYYRTNFRFVNLFIILLVPLGVNLVWLSNFLVGATSVEAAGSSAAAVSFRSLSETNFLTIFNFTFTKATLINKYYSVKSSLLGMGYFGAYLACCVWSKRKDSRVIYLTVLLVIMIFLSIGSYRAFAIKPLSVFYPMLREAGHFAPLVVLLLVLGIGLMRLRRTITIFLAGIVIINVGITIQVYWSNSQQLNFATTRGKFSQFKEHADAHIKGFPTNSSRVLSYPFFGQYSFKGMPIPIKNYSPLSNTGHDSFITYSGLEYINNSIPPDDFKNSLQFDLLSNYNVDPLSLANIKYIYDFSDIYESNYDKYVPKSTYDNNLGLIKNDPDFFDKLIDSNPGKLTRVNDHILEINKTLPRIFSFTNLYMLNSDVKNINSSLTKLTDGQDFNYIAKGFVHHQANAVITALFSDDTTYHTNGSTSYSFNNKDAERAILYIKQNQGQVFYRTTNNRLQIYIKETGSLRVNQNVIATPTASERVIYDQPYDAEKNYYLSLGNESMPVLNNHEEKVGPLMDEPITLLEEVGNNLMDNPSFEEGLWQEKVSDCYAYDDKPSIGMSLNQIDKTDGEFSLQLNALRHHACTNKRIPITGDKQYSLRFDFQSPNAQVANYYIEFDDPDHQVAKGFNSINGNGWQTHTSFISAPGLATYANLYLYAIEGDQKTSTINRYDNFSLKELKKIDEIKVDKPVKFSATEIELRADGNNFSFIDQSYEYRNLIINPDFSLGTWQPQVGDCRNYDDDAKLKMELVDEGESNSSLLLSATRHDACISKTIDIKSDRDYILKFKYKGKGAKSYGYNLQYDDPQNTEVNEKIDIKDKEWHAFEKKINSPKLASTLTLHIYSFETDGHAANDVIYDDFSLIEVPKLQDKYYLVEKLDKQFEQPTSVEYEAITNTRREVHIKGAQSGFFLGMSETYNNKWLLYARNRNQSFLSWMPGKASSRITDHFKLNEDKNGWYIDVVAFCAQQNVCTHNPDGSYDIELIAEFMPQRWFYLSQIISVITFMTSIGYLGISWRIKPRSHELQSLRRYTPRLKRVTRGYHAKKSERKLVQ